MFLGKQISAIERQKQACLLRTEINRIALELMLQKNQLPGEKAITLGIMAADLIYGIWRSKNKKGD